MSIEHRVKRIVEVLDENKAEEIEEFNLQESDYIAQRVIIANALNTKHTGALLDHLKKRLKPEGENFLHVDESESWIVADLEDILIHIMTVEYRQRYSLEEFLVDLSVQKRGTL